METGALCAHGRAVQALAGAGLSRGATAQPALPILSDLASKLEFSLRLRASPLVLNLSAAADSGETRSEGWNNQVAVMRAFLVLLAENAPEGRAQDSCLVMALGNGSSGGLDLGPMVSELYNESSQFQQVFDRGNLVLVGGSGKPGDCMVDRECNYLGADPHHTTVYASNREVPITTPECTASLSGTSAAAPQIANEIARACALDPSVTPAQAAQRLKQRALPMCPGP